MRGTSRSFSIIALNINTFNSPIKRYSLADCIKTRNPTVCYFQETHLTKEIQVKWKQKMETIFTQIESENKQEPAILVSYKSRIPDKTSQKRQYIVVREATVYWKRNNSPTYNNYKSICTKHQCIQFHKTNTKGIWNS